MSRQQVLPLKDAEVAAVLDEFMSRGVKLLKGARGESVTRVEYKGVLVECDDGRRVDASHVVLAIGSVPNSEGLGLEDVGVDVDESGYVVVNHNCLTNVANIYAAVSALMSAFGFANGTFVTRSLRPDGERLGLGEPDVGDLGIGEDRRRGLVVVEVAVRDAL